MKQLIRLFPGKIVLFAVLLVLICSAATAGKLTDAGLPTPVKLLTADSQKGKTPKISLKVDRQFAAVNEKITFKYKGLNTGDMYAPYVQWKIYEYKDGISELVDFLIPWFSTEGPLAGTSGKESYKVKDPEVEAVRIETLLVDYNELICKEAVHVLIGKVPKAVEGLVENGAAQKLVTAGKVRNARFYYAVTSENKAPPEDQYSVKIPSAKDAGTYYVWYKAVSEIFTDDSYGLCIPVEIGRTPLVDEVTVSGGIYELDHSGKTATLVRPKNKSAKQLTIPAAVSANNTEYKVTTVSVKACKGMKNMTKLIIGRNVKSIGSGAFEDCGKLSDITIRTAKLTLKNVGSRAFQTGRTKKTTVRCPNGKGKTYQKILTKRGLDKKKAIFTE